MEYNHPEVNMNFYSFDLNLDPMTVIIKLYLDTVKMYLFPQNEVPNCSGSKVNIA